MGDIMEIVLFWLFLVLLGICVSFAEFLFAQGWILYVKEVQFPALLHFLQWLPHNFKKVVKSS